MPTGNQQNTLAQIKDGIIEESQKPKYKSQYITKLKEIKQYHNELVWDFDQQFKMLMDKGRFRMSDVQHKEWIITTLMPHIRMPLLQENIATKNQAMEIAMKLEASPVSETRMGINQIQLQLVSLAIQL